MTDRENAEALFLDGTRHMEAGDLPGAEICLRNALALAPDLAEAHANLGLLLDRRGAADEAEVCHRRSLALDPSHAETWLNLGANLAERKRFADAEAAYREALARNPQSPAAWSNLGVLYACIKREDEAERCHRTALAIDEAYAKARFNLGYVLLRQGRYEEGWQCLEARDWYAALEARIECPRWRGEPVRGKAVLIAFEAGHGDMIQFCRYAAVLKARGARKVAVVCHPGLKTLFATLNGADEIFSFEEPVASAAYDFWSPPLSLPGYCGTRLDTVPADIPYLRALPERAAHWAARLPPDGARIGLAWKGNPRFENDADRSLPSLETLAPLWSVRDARFVSLQKGAGEDEAAHCARPLLALGPQLADFSETAAVIANLDLVIAVDTAVAHLAGALGKRCFVLLPYYRTDWRWLAERSDSPWYPGVIKLFRQDATGDWAKPVAAVVDEIKGNWWGG